MEKEKTQVKSKLSEQELETLKFWKENHIFEKTLAKTAPKGEYIFYEGPPTANGRPGIHHLEARAFKDAIPRYKTMQGFDVHRKGGWDTHGLPVELAVEKELGLKSKKEIEVYGIEAFNKKCRESVWKYVHEWESFTDRIGYWIDLKRPYVTYKPYYIESIWNIVSKINDQKLLYKDYKVVPWCPRCGTGLSSHELAQGYEDVKDLAVIVKFNVKGEENTYILAWTTTPWTLPGNVGLAVGEKIKYVKVGIKNQESGITNKYILAKERLEAVLKGQQFEVSEEMNGSDLIGLEYEPLYPFLKDNLSAAEREKLPNAFKVYPADFVTTTDGTGIVHTAVMYGADDFELGTKVGLPKHHLVKDDGTFKEEVGFLAGKFVKDENTAIDIIKDLAARGLLFAKEKYQHSYPHCWRCHTPLIYFARDSWYIKMSSLREKLLEENQKINWEPDYIKEGRFGEWLRDVKDWAISRERYWGTPLPVWQCSKCHKHEVVGSFDEIFKKDKNRRFTRLVLVRHGESKKNVLGIFESSKDGFPLTENGIKKAHEAGEKIKNIGVDAIYCSPVDRAKHTAEIIGEAVGIKPTESLELWEVRSGEWEGEPHDDPSGNLGRIVYNALPHDEYYKTPRGKTGESWQQVEDRMAKLAQDVLKKHKGQTVVIVSHEGPLMTLMKHLKNLSIEEIANLWEGSRSFHQGLLGGFAEPTSVCIDSVTGKEIDPHRPFIDEVVFECDCGGEMKRVKEVMDVWFDSGAMPFAQEHYPFKNRERIDTIGFPADFISEAIDQTRGWFYTLHAIGVLMGKGRAYKNVISLGHILDANGKKMSKSLGNVIDPNLMIEKYGSDPLRFWMYSVNQPGEPKNFDEKTVDEIVKKVFNLASNVLAFYQLYSSELTSEGTLAPKSSNVLDRWILAKLNELVKSVTESMDSYKLLEPTRAIRDFIADLSQWYLRRSRDRFKGEDKTDRLSALQTTNYVLLTLSKLMAPFTPFFADYLYKQSGGKLESVHLENWPEIEPGIKGEELGILVEMAEVRRVVSLALEARAKANIKIRQPLAELRIKNLESRIKNQDMLTLIADEVNVKEVKIDESLNNEVDLDTLITPELKKEGSVRDFVRAIQELRKEIGLNPKDFVELSVEGDEKAVSFVQSVETELKNSTQLTKIKYESVNNGSGVSFEDFSLKISISR